ncbi:MAG: ABC transporter ATP-binding protein [Candidatus Omnitrophica bacterium]|nr:ABC transporter ATP-binding protein [Candidatus Omnitrophota bacterium]
MNAIIEVTDIKKYFAKKSFFYGAEKMPVKAVDGVSFTIDKGKTFGLVGESGSGKSTIAKLVTGILVPDSGKMSIEGDIDIVFQDPFSSLNPRMTIRDIVGESLFVKGVNREEIEDKVVKILHRVKMKNMECLDKYPHQFSGGERQRIAIARALVTQPDIVVLDEPVSSLDVSIQAGILNLLKDLQEELALTYLFISHDLRVVEFMSDVVGVMKSGKIVEIASRQEIYSNPQNEYTRHLLSSIPKI